MGRWENRDAKNSMEKKDGEKETRKEKWIKFASSE